MTRPHYRYFALGGLAVLSLGLPSLLPSAAMDSKPRWSAIFDENVDQAQKTFLTKLLTDLGEVHPEKVVTSAKGLRWLLSEPQEPREFLIQIDHPKYCRENRCLTIVAGQDRNAPSVLAMFYAGKFLSVVDSNNDPFNSQSMYFCTTDTSGCNNAVTLSQTARGYIVR